MACVVYSRQFGVFLGKFREFAIWSEVDSAGQEYACVFDSKDEALAFMHKHFWLFMHPEIMEGIDIVDVVPDMETEDGGRFASAQACAQAGLPPWLTALTFDMHAMVYGSAPALH